MKLRTVALGALVMASLAGAGVAQAATYLPPRGKIFAGVQPADPRHYDNQVDAHPAILGDYIVWYGSYGWLLRRADEYHSLAMIDLQTSQGNGPEIITPGQIMRGRGDEWLFKLGKALAKRGKPTYLRMMAEMNGWWNPYCSVDQYGQPKPDHSAAEFRQAWRRIVLILRGGPVHQVNARLRRLHMKPIRYAAKTLPRAPVSFIWNPQTVGSPYIPQNQAPIYYPGNAYVDWVGTDWFTLYPTFDDLDRFYGWDSQWRKPFAFGEWGVWNGDAPGYTSEFLAWVHSHSRVRMLVYYQNFKIYGGFNLARYPRSRAIIRRDLHSGAYAQPPRKWLRSMHSRGKT